MLVPNLISVSTIHYSQPGFWFSPNIPHQTWQRWARGWGKTFLQIAKLVVADHFFVLFRIIFSLKMLPWIFLAWIVICRYWQSFCKLSTQHDRTGQIWHSNLPCRVVSCPVLSCPDHYDQHIYNDHHNHNHNHHNMTPWHHGAKATMIAMATKRKLGVIWGSLGLYTWKLEIFWSHKTSNLLV